MGASRNLSFPGSHPITAFYLVVKSGAEVISLSNTDRVILLTVLDKFKVGLGIAFSPDGKMMAASVDQVINLFGINKQE